MSSAHQPRETCKEACDKTSCAMDIVMGRGTGNLLNQAFVAHTFKLAMSPIRRWSSEVGSERCWFSICCARDSLRASPSQSKESASRTASANLRPLDGQERRSVSYPLFIKMYNFISTCRVAKGQWSIILSCVGISLKSIELQEVQLKA